MSRTGRIAFLLSLFAALGACREARVEPSAGDVRVQPETLQFPPTVIGASRTLGLQVENTSPFSRVVRFEFEVDGPFTASPAERTVAGGDQLEVAVAFEPGAPGVASSSLRITFDGARIDVPLSGEGIIADCPAQTACRRQHVDPETGSCTLVDEPEGTPCDDLCLEPSTASCKAGACVGTARSCDDHNACTVDLCAPASGCIHEPVQCPANDPCLEPVCEPSTGCGTVPASDGTSCGRTGCDVQDVCVRGECLEKVPPDGATCGEPSMCQPVGACAAGVCERPEPTPLARAWLHEEPFGDNFRFSGVTDLTGAAFLQRRRQGEADIWSVLAFEPAGQQRFEVPAFSAGRPSGFGEFESPQVVIGGRLLTHWRLSQVHGEVGARSLTTGGLLWSTDLQTALAPHLPPSQSGAPLGAFPGHIFESAAGGARVIVDAIEGPVPNEGNVKRATFVVDLDLLTGAVVRLFPFDAPTGLSAIGAGDSLFGHRSLQAWRFDEEAQVQWTTPPLSATSSQGLVPLFVTGRFVIAGDQDPLTGTPAVGQCWRWVELVVLDAGTGAELGRPGVWVWMDTAHRVVARDGVAWAVGLTSAQLAVSCESELAPHSVFAIDLETATLRWSRPIPQPGGVPARFGNLTLTSPNTLWALATQPNLSHVLYEFSLADGRVIGACPLGGTTAGYSPQLTLVKDHFYLYPQFGGDRLQGFSASGYQPAAKGWTTRAGNPQRTGRER